MKLCLYVAKFKIRIFAETHFSQISSRNQKYYQAILCQFLILFNPINGVTEGVSFLKTSFFKRRFFWVPLFHNKRKRRLVLNKLYTANTSCRESIQNCSVQMGKYLMQGKYTELQCTVQMGKYLMQGKYTELQCTDGQIPHAGKVYRIAVYSIQI